MITMESNEVYIRFKYSIAIDVFVIFMFLSISGVLALTFIKGDKSFVIPIQFSLISMYYVLGDMIFKNKSIGMKLAKIEVRVIGSNAIPSISAMAKRRLLILLKKTSLFFHPSYSYIEKKTGTYLMLSKRKND